MASPATSWANLPELVRDSQLQARFESDGSQHFIIHTRSSSRHLAQEKWLYQRRLGSGGQGAVELQVRQMTEGGRPQLRAVKTINIPDEVTSSIPKLHQRELETIAKFSQAKYSNHFVKSFGWFNSPGCIHIAMEYCELGDLEKYLAKCPAHRVPEAEAHDISSQILDALCSMHEEKYCHRDLKLANVLIMSTTPSWWVKLADFGLSKRDATMAQTTAVRGTISYMPPELLGYTGDSRSADPYAVDMWCLGQVVFRLVAGQSMLSSIGDLSRYYYGDMQFPEPLLRKHQEIDHNLVTFIKSLTAPRPANRISSKEALVHPWIKTEKHYSGTRNLNLGSVPKSSFIQEEDSDNPSASWSAYESINSTEPGKDSNASFPWTAVDNTQDEASAEWPSQTRTNTVNNDGTSAEQPAAAKTTPSNIAEAENYKIAGNRLFRDRQYIQAIKEYTKALELDPSSTVCLGNRAAAYMTTNQYEAARQDCLRGIESDPYNSKLYNRLFRIYIYTGQPEEATAIFARINPPPPPADIAKATKMQSSVQTAQRIISTGSGMDQAIEALNDAERGLGPGADVPRKWKLMRGEAYVKMNTRESLIEARRIPLSISNENGQDVAVLILHGRILYAQGDMDGAMHYFQRAIEYDAACQDARSWIDLVEKLTGLKEQGNTLFKGGRFHEARDTYTLALTADSSSKPMRAKLFGNRAQCNIRLGNNEAAIADCDRAISLDPDYVKAIRTKGTAAYKCGRFEEALQAWTEAQALDPTDKGTVQNIKLAKTALREGHRGDPQVDDLRTKFNNHHVSDANSPWDEIDPTELFRMMKEHHDQPVSGQSGPSTSGGQWDEGLRRGAPAAPIKPRDDNGPRSAPQDSEIQQDGSVAIDAEDIFKMFHAGS